MDSSFGYRYRLKSQRKKKKEEQIIKVQRDQRLQNRKRFQTRLPADKSDDQRETSLGEGTSSYHQEQGCHASVSAPQVHVPTRKSLAGDAKEEKQQTRQPVAANSCTEVARLSSNPTRPASRRTLAFLEDDSSDDGCVAAPYNSSTGQQQQTSEKEELRQLRPAQKKQKRWEMSSDEEEEDSKPEAIPLTTLRNEDSPSDSTTAHVLQKAPESSPSTANSPSRLYKRRVCETIDQPVGDIKSTFSPIARDAHPDTEDRRQTSECVAKRGLARRAASLDKAESEVPAKKRARNPLSLMKEDFGDPSIQSARITTRNDSLWSDDDDDDIVAANELEKATKKTRKRNSSRKQRATTNFSKVDQKAAPVPSFREPSAEECDVLSHQLIPQFDRPKFGPHDPPEPLVLSPEFQVPTSINRYLPPYQQEGVRFLFERAINIGRGAILGDDMGLGKTVQTVALVASLLKKTGTGLDSMELHRRAKLGTARCLRLELAQQEALREGRIGAKIQGDDGWPGIVKELGLPEWGPILIAAPKSVVSHWKGDFDTWGHFSIAVYRGKNREQALESIENGTAEILICAHSMIQRVQDSRMLRLAKTKWKLLVIDEFHKFKNRDAAMTGHLRLLQDAHESLVVGLTGTVMPNKHEELWNLVDLVAKGFLKSYDDFEFEYEKPIKLSVQKDATREVVEEGHRKKAALREELKALYLQRKKEIVLAGVLPEKDESIVFCEPSDLQKRLYNHIIGSPDYDILRKSNSPCDCGVNQKFFLEFQHLRSRKDKVEYHRRHKAKLIPRRKCCYKCPWANDGSGTIDSGAVLWVQQHEGNVPCASCPKCTLLVAISILVNVSSHAALLQADTPPDQFGEGSRQRRIAEDRLARATQFIPEDCLPEMPGGFIRGDSVMDDHFGLSGKMAALDKLLARIYSANGRVLLFSCFTSVLALIQNYLESKGYFYHRMDGKTPQNQRDVIANDFRTNRDSFVFLLSTKAMGTGLNLKEANFVIIFDPDWNPANDQQAQDRAYRIGQENDVKVIRLITQGTVEEMKYLRQIYKTSLTNETMESQKEHEASNELSGRFRGVQKDRSRKGELFGLENLIKFKDGKFMRYPKNEQASREFGLEMYDAGQISDRVNLAFEDELGGLENDPTLYESDDGGVDECHLGGESQNAIDVMENLVMPRSPSPLTPVPELEEVQDCQDKKPMKPPAYLSRSKQTPPRSKNSTEDNDSSGAQRVAKRWQEGSLDFRSVETQYTSSSSPGSKGEIPSVAVVQRPSFAAARTEPPVDQEDTNQKRNFTLVGKTNRDVKGKGTAGLRFCAKDLPPSSR